MELPNDIDLETGFEDLKTSSVSETITQEYIATDSDRPQAEMEYPAYILEHNEHITLPHSLEAVEGLLHPEGDSLASVYVTPSLDSGELFLMGKGEAQTLEDLLLIVIDSMFNKQIKVYYSPDGIESFYELTNNLSKIKLEL